jgi:hypothetical protein
MIATKVSQGMTVEEHRMNRVRNHVMAAGGQPYRFVSRRCRSSPPSFLATSEERISDMVAGYITVITV